MKFTLRIVILGLALIILLGTVEITPTSAVSGYRKLLQLGRGSIESAEWHPSGKRIVVNSVMGAWFYDDSLQDIAHLDDIRVAHFNATGELMAAGQGNQVVLFEAMTLKQVKILAENDSELADIRWSPDGKKLAVITDKPMVTVWDVGTTQVLFTFRPPTADIYHRNYADYVVWSPHSDKIATFNVERTDMVIWNVDTRQIQSSFDVVNAGKERADGGRLVWNPDNVHIFHAVSGEYEVFQYWDTSTGTLLYENTSNGTGIAFNSDGTQVVVTRLYRDGNMVDPLTFEPQRPLAESEDVSRLTWSPDNTLLAGSGSESVDDGGLLSIGTFIQVWDMMTGNVLHHFRIHSYVESLAWSPDSKHILSVNADGMLRILDARTGQIAHERDDHSIIGGAVMWSPDGSRIAVADAIGKVRIWDAISGQLVQTLTGHGDTMLLAWQPAGNLLAVASYDDPERRGAAKNTNLRIWDTTTGQLVDSSPLARLRNYMHALSLSWDRQGKRLVATSDDGQFWLWDKTGLSAINWTKEAGHEIYSMLRNAIFSPDGKYLLILSYGCCAGITPSLWDLTQHKLIYVGKAQNGAYVWASTSDKVYLAPLYIDFSRYGKSYAPKFLEQTNVYIQTIFQTDTQAAPPPDVVLVNPIRRVVSVVWNPDSTGIAVIGDDKTLRIWDVLTGQKLLVINFVSSATWSPDGTKLAVRGSQGETRIINAENGEVMDTIDNLGQSPVWSPDSTRIADVSSGTLTIWGKE